MWGRMRKRKQKREKESNYPFITVSTFIELYNKKKIRVGFNFFFFCEKNCGEGSRTNDSFMQRVTFSFSRMPLLVCFRSDFVAATLRGILLAVRSFPLLFF